MKLEAAYVEEGPGATSLKTEISVVGLELGMMNKDWSK